MTFIILITKNGFILTKGKADFLVSDDAFMKIMKSNSLQQELLKDRPYLGIGRVGVQENEGVYNCKPARDYINTIDTLKFRREFGYYARC